MLNRIVSAVLVAVSLFAATSAQAGVTFQCELDGTRVDLVRGKATCACSRDVVVGAKCPFNNAPPSGSASAPQQTPMSFSASAPIAGTAPGAVVLNQGDLDELRRQYESDKAALRPVSASAPQAAPQAPAVQVPAQPFRVFTPGVSIEVLAGAFKEGSESNVLNAPIGEVEAAIARFSGVDVSPELLVKGALVDCQKAGVEGKHRVGVKSKQKMNGLKEFNFATIGSELKDCQSGQKLYVVQDRNGKNVAVADNSGYLLGKAPTVAEIKVDR